MVLWAEILYNYDLGVIQDNIQVVHMITLGYKCHTTLGYKCYIGQP